MISKEKTYRTRTGYKVSIYSTDLRYFKSSRVLCSITQGEEDSVFLTWDDGKVSPSYESGLDLIETDQPVGCFWHVSANGATRFQLSPQCGVHVFHTKAAGLSYVRKLFG